MTTRCPDLDALVSLCLAFDWRPDEALRHLAACDICRSALRDLVTLRRALDVGVQPRAGLVEEVARLLGGHAAVGRRRPKSAQAVALLLVPVLAGLTALTTLTLAAGPGAPAQPGPAVLLSLSFGVALAAFLRNRIRPSMP